MTTEFAPKLSVLQPQQRRLWEELRDVPESFVLCGGTAIALQLGHRTSVDFDFISREEFDPDSLRDRVRFLRDSATVQKAGNTLSCIVDRRGDVHVSFFGAPSMRLIGPPLVARDNGLKVATLLDLAGMKAAVVQKRAEARDYIDIDALISRSGVPLTMALAAAQAIYGQSFNPELTLKSLCFFGDGDLDTVPHDVRERLVTAVRSINVNELPKIDDAKRQLE